MKHRAICFPGFLGAGSDFSFLSMPFDCVEYFAPSSEQNMQQQNLLVPFDQFPDRIQSSQIKSHHTVAIGYSLGGRLLLHCALRQPNLFQKIVIIAAHTGLTNESEKISRREHDTLWSKRFLHEPWDAVVDAWNKQPVLHSAHIPTRLEQSYSRTALAHALTSWSLGEQENLIPQLANASVPILWIVGEHDKKFVELGRQAAEIANHMQLKVVPDAGHRVMWEKPQILDTLIRTYVETD